MNTRLQLYNGSEWVNMPLKEDIPISLNLSINDVRNPENVKSTDSKTVIIPFSNESKRFFEFIFQANVELQTFNPNLKTRAEVYHGERRTTRGHLQLIKVNKIDNGSVTQGEFECSIIGDTGNFFTDIGDMFLHELDLSDLDHAFFIGNAYGTPGAPNPTTIGSGYAYGFIDYGTGNINNTIWSFEDLKPGVFEREYLLRIFQEFGYTWDSDFLDSAYYKRRFVPCVNEGRLKLSSSVINANQFYAGRPSNLSSQVAVSSYYFTSVNTNAWGTAIANNYTFGSGTPPPPVTFTHSAYVTGGQLLYSDETTSPWFDGGTVYNNSTSVFTAGAAAYYELGTYNEISVDFINSPTGAVYILPDTSLTIEAHFQITGPSGVVSTGIASTSLSGVTAISTITMSATNSVNNILCAVSDAFQVNLVVKVVGSIKYLNNLFVEVTGGTPQLRFGHNQDSTFYAKISNADLQYNETVSMNDTIPRDYKIRDFVKSIIQTFNLRMEPSKTDPYTLIIEPHYDFYNFTNQLDWTEKLDVSSQQEVIPMGELDWKTLDITYKSDSDHYNQDYLSKKGYVYGNQLVEVNNEFIKNEKKIEILYSPTPIARVQGSPVTVPKIFKMSNTGAQAIKANIRVLYWGGRLTCPAYTYTVGPFYSTQTEYSYVGHVDNPDSPTLDLSFDNPLLLYWNYIGQTYTNNNIWNNYWARYIDEVTDPDSKIWRADFYLDEVDISNFSFRNIVFVKDAYWYVNKVIDYNPLKKDTCRVELLKLKTAPEFTAEVIEAEGGGGIGQAEAVGADTEEVYNIVTGNANFNYAGNNDGYQAQSYGVNNFNAGGLIIGEGNVIL